MGGALCCYWATAVACIMPWAMQTALLDNDAGWLVAHVATRLPGAAAQMGASAQTVAKYLGAVSRCM